MFKVLKSRKGISPILATLLLIVIAVAAIIVTYAWVMTYMGTQTQQAGAWITTDASPRWYGNPVGAQNRTDLYIRNIGTTTVTIARVYVGISPSNLIRLNSTNVIAGMNTSVDPGKIVTITIQWPISEVGNEWISHPRTTYYFSISTEPGGSYSFQNAPS